MNLNLSSIDGFLAQMPALKCSLHCGNDRFLSLCNARFQVHIFQSAIELIKYNIKNIKHNIGQVVKPGYLILTPKDVDLKNENC